MNTVENLPSLEEILAANAEEEALGESPLGHYVEVTPRALAKINLYDCREQLQRWKMEPIRLAQAAKSAHLAIQAALTDALAGSAGIGAFSDKLQAAYLEYFDKFSDGDAKPPEGDFVLRFDAMLERAMLQPLEWSGQCLEVSPQEKKAIDQLTFIRHRIEHPRPQLYFIKPQFIAQILPISARLTLQLLDVGAHHYMEGERAGLETVVAAISALCVEID